MLKQIKDRRSIRSYKSIPIPWDKLFEVINAARYTPTPGDIQNFSLILVTKPELILNISKITDQEWVKTAPVILVIVADFTNNDYDSLLTHHAVGAIVQNILLEATNQKLGSCWIESFNKEALKSLLNIDNDPVSLITLGFSNEVLSPKYLKPLQLFLYYNSAKNTKWEYVKRANNPQYLTHIDNLIKHFKAKLIILKDKIFK